MIERGNGALVVRGAMVMANARALLAAGCAEMGGDSVVDLSAVDAADSSALAVMLGWLRHAQAAKLRLSFVGVPAGVLSLAELYGISDLLPLA